MALANILILSQIAGNVITLILSLCLAIPMSLHVHDFNGHCLLFATGTWREDDGLFNASWPSQTCCNYPIVAGVLLFIISSVQIYRLSKLAYREEESSFLGLFIDVVVGIWLSASLLMAAIDITLGFIVWCSYMTQRFPSCEIVAGQNIMPEDDKISTSGFYMQIGTAQFAAWGSFAFSVGLGVVAFLKLINNHQMRNMRVSMYLERQRLMNEDVQQGPNDGRSTPPITSSTFKHNNGEEQTGEHSSSGE